MDSGGLRHRLLAVLAADVAGYSRLVSQDDRATVNALDAARAVFRRRIEGQGGRVVDMAGDSVLSVFDSAISAVEAAIAIQDECNAAQAAVPAGRQLLFRIGVHVGDVIEKPDGTVYGDGVNIAARLEALARPGAVALSQAVHGMVQRRVARGFDDLGEQSVKNIAQPIHAYQVRMPATAGPAAQAPLRLQFKSARAEVDLAARQLLIEGQPAKLGGRAFDLLMALIERHERVVPKQELLDLVWPGLVVEENNLQVHVMTLRRLLGAQAISTVSGRGYRWALGAPGSGAVVASGPTPVAPVPVVPRDVLFGRDTLRAQLRHALLEQGQRLLTLTGPGGTGKTRLALRVAAELAPAWPDGASVTLLAPVRDSEQLMAAVADALGLQEAGSTSMGAVVQGYLRERHMLLVLDNLEHLPQAAVQVAALLTACPRLHILATSRVLLHLAQEQEIKVPPLSLPTQAQDAAGSDAVALFAARACALGCDVMESPEGREAAVQICRRLDGLPLAIELAAARLRTLTPVALAARLQQSLPLLKSSSGDRPQRQQTLRDTIAWSHDLLDKPAQVLMRRLAVFVGGWSLEAAEALARDGSALDALESLIDHNLVQRVDDVAGQPRYAMLETIREYALEQLTAAGEQAAARQQHAAFCSALAQAGAAELVTAARANTLLRLRAEMNNFRLALAWLTREQPDSEAALALAAALTWLWYFDGLYREGLGWMEAALQLQGSPHRGAAAAAVLSGMARLCGFSGDMTRAHALAESSVALWRGLGDRRGLAFALFHQGVPALFHAGLAAARSTLQEARECFRSVDDVWGVAMCTVYEGVVLSIRPGQDDEALPLLNEGFARAQALGDEWAASTCSGYIGAVALRRGDWATARRGFSHILTQARENGDRFRIARSTHLMSELELAEGHPAEALSLLGEALVLALEQGRQADQPQLLRSMACALSDLGQHGEAAALLGAANELPGQRSTLPAENQAAVAAAREASAQALGPSALETQMAQGARWTAAQAARQAQDWVRAFGRLSPS